MEEKENINSTESTEKVTATVETNNNQNNQTQQNQPESKTAIGVVCGIFAGLIGLIIGLLLFKDGSYERKTFIKGWLWAFCIAMAVEFIATIVILLTVDFSAIYAPIYY